jgi:hypothetical protein
MVTIALILKAYILCQKCISWLDWGISFGVAVFEFLIMRSPKDILLLLLAGIVCGLLAMLFWRFFGVYGFAIIAMMVSSGLIVMANRHRRKR